MINQISPPVPYFLNLQRYLDTNKTEFLKKNACSLFMRRLHLHLLSDHSELVMIKYFSFNKYLLRKLLYVEYPYQILKMH